MVESARISRGNVKDLIKLNVEDYDALIIPGGFGVAKNLSDFAIAGQKMEVDPDVENILREFKNK